MKENIMTKKEFIEQLIQEQEAEAVQEARERKLPKEAVEAFNILEKEIGNVF